MRRKKKKNAVSFLVPDDVDLVIEDSSRVFTSNDEFDVESSQIIGDIVTSTSSIYDENKEDEEEEEEQKEKNVLCSLFLIVACSCVICFIVIGAVAGAFGYNVLRIRNG